MIMVSPKDLSLLMFNVLSENRVILQQLLLKEKLDKKTLIFKKNLYLNPDIHQKVIALSNKYVNMTSGEMEILIFTIFDEFHHKQASGKSRLWFK